MIDDDDDAPESWRGRSAKDESRIHLGPSFAADVAASAAPRRAAALVVIFRTNVLAELLNGRSRFKRF